MHWISAAATHVGRRRQINEDALLDRPDAGMWAVADGMGGHHAGDVASTSIITALSDVTPSDRLSSYVNSVEDRLFGVNQRLQSMAKERNENCTIGSTIITMLTTGGHNAFLWAGDSRAYLFRDNLLSQLTSDHSQVEELVQRNLLSPEEAESHPASNIITRAIGAAPELFVGININETKPGDTYLLCSDGLYKHLNNDDMENILGQENVHAIVHSLIDLTLERGASDNVTVVVTRATTDSNDNI